MLYNIKIVFHFRKWNKKLQKRYFLLRIFCAIEILFVTLPCNSRTMICNLKQPYVILNLCCSLEDARVRQLKRTELAWRVESAQCLRSPHSLTKLAGAPIDSYYLEDGTKCLLFSGRFATV